MSQGRSNLVSASTTIFILVGWGFLHTSKKMLFGSKLNLSYLIIPYFYTMSQCNSAVTPMHKQWGDGSLLLSHRVEIRNNFPLLNSSRGGSLDSPCLSVCLSVCPCVRLSVCPLAFRVRPVAWIDSFHIWYKWSIAWEGVSHVMTLGLDLYLQGHSALT